LWQATVARSAIADSVRTSSSVTRRMLRQPIEIAPFSSSFHAIGTARAVRNGRIASCAGSATSFS
jgi:hypothetical protein